MAAGLAEDVLRRALGSALWASARPGEAEPPGGGQVPALHRDAERGAGARKNGASSCRAAARSGARLEEGLHDLRRGCAAACCPLNESSTSLVLNCGQKIRSARPGGETNPTAIKAHFSQ